MSCSCSCKSCQNACTYTPGWFLPKELNMLAIFLKKDKQEVFDKYLGVDWFEGEKTIFLVAPAITNMKSGQEYPGDPRGRCVFYKKNKCSIYEVRPYECKNYIHDESLEKIHLRHQYVADSWKEKQDIIIDLLGREPEEEEYVDFFGMFGF